ncbi:3-dehydro-L-gulonate 2-dehydrogenase [Mariniphaga sediminis]|jgi:3-dehydro-L-gulonate 2-dehydrogenase|uniref:3-dehydro-L-gulonate 2-dehydrogenase n=1 Tax=Mariniphaga sediminis TaxID=1628158 RepID=A0A399D6J2_9BACT|nr:3-dehydro-L-gulonate 2-dehydrogenase [Mariniphaga sediminis]RIH66341.1 3-dehydro-L-gulonate 2-dehydrogenase [Mariniphaga sediminis]
MKEVNVPFNEMQSVFRQILQTQGFSEDRADTCARIFAENSLDGIYSHGVYRFPRFLDFIKRGFVKVNAGPTLVHTAGALEQWDGNLGPGPLNAMFCTERAMQLADNNGLGCVAVANTNHWMRGGTYGWQAAKKGFAFIGWTNTEANMPAWGARSSRLGNNPLIFAVPFGSEAVVLDFAMTQFSYGKMETAQLQGKILPYPGGFNSAGNLTNQPSEILDSFRALPIGYWKGAGLSLLLDILAAVLSSGLATHQISKQEVEYGVSQVFVAISLEKLSNFPAIEKTINEIISDFKGSVRDESHSEIRYPGERAIRTRKENLKKGIPVNKKVWEEICQSLPLED